MSLRIPTIMNRLLPIKGFRYARANWEDSGEGVIKIQIASRKNSRGLCSKCERPGPTYDHLPERSWRFIPLWAILVFLKYAPRRIKCRDCGVHVEKVPWATGKLHLADPFRLLLSHWARKLSWKETAQSFRVNWNDVFSSIKWVVAYGKQHRSLEGTYAIGIDEIHVRKKNTKFWTLVYQIDENCRRLLWVGKGRSAKTLHGFLDSLTDSIREGIKVVCSDMCQAYLTVVAERLGHALQILDRFHIRKMQNEAVDDIRREEAKAMAEAGLDPLLKKTRWIFLKNRGNWTRREKQKAGSLQKANLRNFRTFVFVESFGHFWKYKSSTWAGKFLDQWCRKVAWSKLEPLKKRARSIKKHRPLLLNYFKARKVYSSGVVEGLNNKVKLVIKRSYGFRTDEALELALYHSLGKLPEPKLTPKLF